MCDSETFLVPMTDSDPYIILKEIVNATLTPNDSLCKFMVRLSNLLTSFIKAVQSSKFIPEEGKHAAPSFGKLATFGAIRELMPLTAFHAYDSNPPTVNMEPLAVLIHIRDMCAPGTFPYIKPTLTTMNPSASPVFYVTTQGPDKSQACQSSKASVMSSCSARSAFSNHSRRTCYNCGYRGHIAANCMSGQSKKRRIENNSQANLPYCTFHRIHGHDTSECNALYNSRYFRSSCDHSYHRTRRGNRGRSPQNNQSQSVFKLGGI